MSFDFSAAIKRLQGILTDTLVRIPDLLIALLFFIASLLLARYARTLVRKIVKSSNRPDSLGVLLGRLTRWSVISLGMLISLLIAFPGFSLGQLVQLLGLGGLAAGIAFRNIFEDFFSGVLLLLNQTFVVGDQIILQDYEGTIESIEARTTSIRTYDGRRVIVPNSDLFTNIVTVNTAYKRRRIQYDIGIGYGDDIETASRVILETLESLPEVEQTPEPEVLVVDLASYQVTLRARWWIMPPRRRDAMETRTRVLSAVKKALQSNGIDLPFPTQQVLFHDQTEETDGNRRRQREGWPAGRGEVPAPHQIATALSAAYGDYRDQEKSDKG